MGTVTNLRLRGVANPPPAAPRKAADAEMRRRARRALRLMERGLAVTDDLGYQSRNTAKAAARRLADSLTGYEGVDADHMLRTTRLRADGWHWFVQFKAAHQPRRS